MKVGILNTSILTGGEGKYSLQEIDKTRAKSIINKLGFISAIGHTATAEVISTLLETEIPANRIQFKQETNQACIVFQLNKRIEEGRILNSQEIEEIGYSLYLLSKEE